MWGSPLHATEATKWKKYPTAMCKCFNSYIFYAEDLNLQILNKVRR